MKTIKQIYQGTVRVLRMYRGLALIWMGMMFANIRTRTRAAFRALVQAKTAPAVGSAWRWIRRMAAQPVMQTVTELPEDAAEHPNTLYLVLKGGDAT